MLREVRRFAQHSVLYSLLRNEQLGEHEAMGANSSFDVNTLDQSIIFRAANGAELRGRARFLASIAVQPATLLWGFSPIMEQSTGPNEMARQVREFGRGQGLAQLSEEEVAYEWAEGADQKDAIVALGHDVGQMGVEFFGPDVWYYTYPTGTHGSRGVVILDQLSQPLGPVTIQDVFVKLPRLAGLVDDLGWALDGLVKKLPGWRLEWRQDSTPTHQVFRVLDAQDAFFVGEVTYDDQRRITNLKFDGPHNVAR